jgi:hypothetical protein
MLKKLSYALVAINYFLSLGWERIKSQMLRSSANERSEGGVRVSIAFNGKGLLRFRETANEATPTLTLPHPRGREMVFQHPANGGRDD